MRAMAMSEVEMVAGRRVAVMRGGGEEGGDGGWIQEMAAQVTCGRREWSPSDHQWASNCSTATS